MSRKAARAPAARTGNAPAATPSPPENQNEPGGDHREARRREPLELGVAGHGVDVHEVVQTHECERDAEEQSAEQEQFAREGESNWSGIVVSSADIV